MSEWLAISLLTFVTGFSMVIGALIAKVEHISNRWLESELRHTVIAFGGGILVSAVSLVLVHEGIKDLTPFLAILCFSAGGVAFMGVDTILSKMHQKASQLVAMVLDFVPEVIALGALYLLDQPYAILLACMIILQNIPEGFIPKGLQKSDFRRRQSTAIRRF
ncbi:MAG: hypothetical protein KDK44_03450 [Chlamydiia bacterium]|nr:hypothetical protein [Chlamydiia bacterium]MCB1117380.1 hypothetical protein [Chlamydiia bacterium]MCP5491574.1 hypothetical protein [Chlamydiales bacterium]